MTSRTRGFTLIEMMVALTIFSFIGVAAYRLLDSTNALRATGEGRYESVNGLQSALRLFEDDMLEISARPVVGEDGKKHAALESAKDDALVSLTRGGWRNPLGLPRSRLQRVTWTLDENGHLSRSYNAELDNPDPDAAIKREIANDIDSVEIRFLDDKGKWVTAWPPAAAPIEISNGTPAVREDPNTKIPVAVELHIVQRHLGEVIRLVALR